MYDVALAGHPVRAVVDSYASHNFISEEHAQKLKLNIRNTDNMEVELGDSSKANVLGEARAVLNMKGCLNEERMLVIKMKENSTVPTLILGRSWLQQHNPQINWQTNVLKMKHSNGTVVTIESYNFV